MLCSALPSFAFDYYNFTDNSGITDSEYDSLLQSLLDQEIYSENNFVMLRAVNSDGLIIVSILSFNRDYDWKLYIDNEGYYAVHLASDGDYVYRTTLSFYVFDTSSRTFSEYLSSIPDKLKAESNPYFSNCDIFRQGDYKNPIYHENTIVQDPNAPVTPFTVSYSRTLKSGMTREATQDGELVTVNTLDVCVQMTNEYKSYIEKSLLADSEIPGAGATFGELLKNKKDKPVYTYQYLMFISTYDPNIYGTKKSAEHAIYTYLDNNKYVLTSSYGSINYSSPGSLGAGAGFGQALDSSVDSNTDSISNVGVQTSQTAQGIGYNAYCEGVTPLFGLPLSGEYANHHTINLANIYGAEDFDEQDILYIVVVGKRYLWETGAEGYASDFYANNAQFKTFFKELPDDVISSVANDLKGNKVYDFYTTVSDGFSFKDYPAYTPLTIDGKEYPTNLPIANMLDKPFTPNNYTDYDGLESGNKFNSKDKFDDYINNKSVNDAIANNFANINYTDLGSLFDVTGDYFKFLTAALSILPSWFLTIFTAWFILFLGIALVKVALAIGSSVSGS